VTTYEDEGLQRMKNVDRENNNLEDVVVGYGCMILWNKTNYVHDYGGTCQQQKKTGTFSIPHMSPIGTYMQSNHHEWLGLVQHKMHLK
jgi:hypothetical protein